VSQTRRPSAPAPPSGPRYVCVHGHFYQPPRESPWLDAIETQPSAAPFHDWNERVSAECYRPNAFARILDEQGRIERIVNNYERMSWNFGPTLLSWMEHADPQLYRALQEADRARVLATGRGPGMAQVYGHAILPLCNDRDRATQVRWGARDFRHRFGRAPRGMWLAETACDIPSLEALAAEGIEFTVLAPHQAQRWRGPSGRWHEVRGRIDPRRPYLARLPSGRSIHLFFYDGPVSQAVAFERLLEDGVRFRDRLVSAFGEGSDAQLAHIATDGETYGHHHRFGEMALAYALDLLAKDPRFVLTTYEELLARHPVTHEVVIAENTAWSCAHGIERWRSDCGCSTGGGPGWNQAWREPLRDALDALRDEVNTAWEPAASALFHDPWGARDRYVELILDPRRETRERFLRQELRRADDAGEPDAHRGALELLEMQRHLLLMYTSCGWFFSDLSGIETIQVLRYAARALELASQRFGDRFEAPFLARLGRAKSNVAGRGDGASLWQSEVIPARVDLERAAVHVASRTVIEGPTDRDPSMPAFQARLLDRGEEHAGRARLGTGTCEVRRRSTDEAARFEYAVVHLGDHNLSGGVRPASGGGPSTSFRADLAEAFRRFELPEVLRGLDRHFPGRTFSLRALTHDAQARILRELLAETRQDIDRAYASLYAEHAPLMRYLSGLGHTPPAAMEHAASHVLSARIAAALDREGGMDLAVIEATLAEARASGVKVDPAVLVPRLVLRFETLLDTGDLPSLEGAAALATILEGVPSEPHLKARAEEAVVRARDRHRSGTRTGHGAAAASMQALLERLGGLLRVAV